jgi:uncharacterized repeat protein (TIGR03847 family)
MARQVHEHDPPDRFVAGTVGPPGQRAFFLQARSGSRTTTVGLEKQQVAALAERVDELLDEVLRRSGGSAAVPAVAPADTEDLEPLDTPIEEEFRVGTMSLAWDGDRETVVIECFEVGEETGDEAVDDLAEELGVEAVAEAETAGTVMRVSLSGADARAFAKRALALVAAGRPPCPFCAGPLDPEGHVCPRANGYRR